LGTPTVGSGGEKGSSMGAARLKALTNANERLQGGKKSKKSFCNIFSSRTRSCFSKGRLSIAAPGVN